MTDPLARNPMLIIDTASRRVSVAVIDRAGELRSRSSQEEASLTLFPLIETLLADSKLSLSDLYSIAYCEGPGSMLGIRTALMGIRAWRGAGLIENATLYSFNSLRVGKLLLNRAHPDQPSFIVVTDARRNSWNSLEIATGSERPIAILKNDELEASPLPVFSFDEFPSWTQSGAPIVRIPYRPESVFDSSEFPSMLQANSNAEPFTIRSMEFVKWTPQARTADHIKP